MNDEQLPDKHYGSFLLFPDTISCCITGDPHKNTGSLFFSIDGSIPAMVDIITTEYFLSPPVKDQNGKFIYKTVAGFELIVPAIIVWSKCTGKEKRITTFCANDIDVG
jgi:hypothetical protein